MKTENLLAEYCRRNAGNLPQNVKDQCSAVKKVLKEVILFPKEAKGVVNKKNKDRVAPCTQYPSECCP